MQEIPKHKGNHGFLFFEVQRVCVCGGIGCSTHGHHRDSKAKFHFQNSIGQLAVMYPPPPLKILKKGFPPIFFAEPCLKGKVKQGGAGWVGVSGLPLCGCCQVCAFELVHPREGEVWEQLQ